MSYVNSGSNALAGPSPAAMLVHVIHSGENAMSAPSKPAGGDASADESLDDRAPAPDEDGPHDVPDDKVIEKTLPKAPGPGGGRGDSGPG